MAKRNALALLALLTLLPSGARASVFSAAEIGELSCAAMKMQLFYYYLSPQKDDKVRNYPTTCKGNKVTYVMPPWIDEALPEMTSRKVWRDPEEGDVSEAAVWQTPVSIIYEYLDLTRKTFPADKGGAGIAPGLLVKEYADIRIRFQMSLDRLYRARTRVTDSSTGKPRDIVMGDSMFGRGRTLMPTFTLILKQMESVADAISSGDAVRYREALTASAVLSQDIFKALFNAPRIYQPMQKDSPFGKMLRTALTFFGMFLLFIAVKFGYDAFTTEDTGAGAVNDFNGKVAKYTEQFGRQFIKINVRYLMLAPAVIFGLLGLLTMNLLLFGFLVGLGLYVGMRLPPSVLTFMKQQRGLKIDAQLMDGLILLSNCLRSGLDIVQGFEMVSKDLLPPISDEFGLVIKNYQLGMTFEKALGVMEERVDSKMLSYMIRAIVLQRQMGGNLTKVFERIVVDIREESKLEEKTKAMTAQQKIQSIVVGIMPWVMVGVMFLFQPEVMIRFYAKPLGMLVGMFCIVWVGIGMKVVSSLGKIRV